MVDRLSAQAGYLAVCLFIEDRFSPSEFESVINGIRETTGDRGPFEDILEEVYFDVDGYNAWGADRSNSLEFDEGQLLARSLDNANLLRTIDEASGLNIFDRNPPTPATLRNASLRTQWPVGTDWYEATMRALCSGRISELDFRRLTQCFPPFDLDELVVPEELSEKARAFQSWLERSTSSVDFSELRTTIERWFPEFDAVLSSGSDDGCN